VGHVEEKDVELVVDGDAPDDDGGDRRFQQRQMIRKEMVR